MLLLAGAEVEAGGAGIGSSENAMCCGWTAFPLAGLPAGGAAAAVKYSAATGLYNVGVGCAGDRGLCRRQLQAHKLQCKMQNAPQAPQS